MNGKLIGAALLVLACGGAGFQLAAGQLRQERLLRGLDRVLSEMSCEMEYRLSPLPELCRQAAGHTAGTLSRVFSELAKELESQMSPDAACCMHHVLSRVNDLPRTAVQVLTRLGDTLGRYDLPGQLQGLEEVRADCRRYLRQLETGREARLRGYRTLGLCAGAALAILLL